jgi:DNA (cytosine-5)-methyltransferase 1
MTWRMLDLFSGIGGFSLAAQWVWGDELEIVAFCEIDKFCQKVLHKHWPNVPIIEDVRDVTQKTIQDPIGKRLLERENEKQVNIRNKWEPCSRNSEWIYQDKRIDLLTGGFPCQPFSCAGKRKGKEDNRFLWPEMFAVIKEIRPRWVVAENVAGIIRMELDNCLSDLEGEGYSCQTIIIPACSVNAPHRRNRVWIVGYSNESRTWEQIGNLRFQEREKGIGKIRFREMFESGSQDVADNILNSKRATHSQRSDRRRTDSKQNNRNILGNDFGNGNQTFGWWSVESDVGRGFDGFPSWLYRHCGRGLSYAESLRRTEVLRKLWTTNVSEALWSAVGGLGRMEEAEVLFAFVCEYEKNPNETRLLLESEKALEAFVRGVWRKQETYRSPYRPEQGEQRTLEHPNTLQMVSRLSSFDIETPWNIKDWEDGISRVSKGVKNRVDRLKSLGNAIVPQVAYQIFKTIRKLEGEND